MLSIFTSVNSYNNSVRQVRFSSSFYRKLKFKDIMHITCSRSCKLISGQSRCTPRISLELESQLLIELVLSAFSLFRLGSTSGSIISTYPLLDRWPLRPRSLAFQEIQRYMWTLVYSCQKVTCLKTPRSLDKTIQKDFKVAHPIKSISLWENWIHWSEGGDSLSYVFRLVVTIDGAVLSSLTSWLSGSFTPSHCHRQGLASQSWLKTVTLLNGPSLTNPTPPLIKEVN